MLITSIFSEYAVGRDPNDPTSLDPPEPHKDDNLTISDLHRIKIGIPREFIEADQSQDCKRIWKDAVKVLKQKGAQVEVISLPHTKYTVECYYILNEIDVFSNMARLVFKLLKLFSLLFLDTTLFVLDMQFTVRPLLRNRWQTREWMDSVRL